jgi:hypothetical protein
MQMGTALTMYCKSSEIIMKRKMVLDNLNRSRDGLKKPYVLQKQRDNASNLGNDVLCSHAGKCYVSKIHTWITR